MPFQPPLSSDYHGRCQRGPGGTARLYSLPLPGPAIIMSSVSIMSCRPAAWLLIGLAVGSMGRPLPSARAAETWEQLPEKQPTGIASEVPAVKKGVADWIWGPSVDGVYRLSKSFAGGAKKGVITATCDNRMTLFVNGKEVATSDSWDRPVAVDIMEHLDAVLAGGEFERRGDGVGGDRDHAGSDLLVGVVPGLVVDRDHQGALVLGDVGDRHGEGRLAFGRGGLGEEQGSGQQRGREDAGAGEDWAEEGKALHGEELRGFGVACEVSGAAMLVGEDNL